MNEAAGSNSLDPTRGKVADRLRVEAEAIMGERVANPRRGRLGPLRAALLLVRVAEEGDLVLSLLLGPVHRLVGGDQDRLAAGFALAAEHSDPDANRDALGVRRGGGALGDRGAQVLSKLEGPGGVGLRHQHRELVAREAGDNVSPAHPLPQDVRDLADQDIAGMVAEGVVDLLEAVDVDDHHRPLAAIASAERDVLVQLRAKAPPVEQPGQRVVIGEIAQLGLGLLGLGQGSLDDLPVLGIELAQDGVDLRLGVGPCSLNSHLGKVRPTPPKPLHLAQKPRMASQFRREAWTKTQASRYP
jgi:hypothetical protein